MLPFPVNNSNPTSHCYRYTTNIHSTVFKILTLKQINGCEFTSPIYQTNNDDCPSVLNGYSNTTTMTTKTTISINIRLQLNSLPPIGLSIRKASANKTEISNQMIKRKRPFQHRTSTLRQLDSTVFFL